MTADKPVAANDWLWGGDLGQFGTEARPPLVAPSLVATLATLTLLVAPRLPAYLAPLLARLAASLAPLLAPSLLVTALLPTLQGSLVF